MGELKAAGEHLTLNRIQSYSDGILEDRRTAQQFSISLLFDRTDAGERKIRSGACASASEFVRALLERDAAVERWLREDIVPSHRECLADCTKGVPADAVLKRIKSRRGARKPE